MTSPDRPSAIVQLEEALTEIAHVAAARSQSLYAEDTARVADLRADFSALMKVSHDAIALLPRLRKILEAAMNVASKVHRSEPFQYGSDVVNALHDALDADLPAWRRAIMSGGDLFGRPILTREEMRRKTDPFPDE